MPNKTTVDLLDVASIAPAKLARISPLSSPGHHSDICIIGVGSAGTALFDALMRDAKHEELNMTHVARNTWGTLCADQQAHPFASTHLMLVLCCAHAPAALRLAAATARAIAPPCATVIVLLTQASAVQVDRATAQDVFDGCVSALLIQPPDPPPEFLWRLIDALRRALVNPSTEGQLCAKAGVYVIDVREVFTGCTTVVTGSASAEGPKRARQAVSCALAELGTPTLSEVTGVLVLIVGPPSMRLNEIDEVASLVPKVFRGCAEIALGVFGTQYGSALRVTVVAALKTHPEPRAGVINSKRRGKSEEATCTGMY